MGETKEDVTFSSWSSTEWSGRRPSVRLVQRFGLVPDSSGQTVDGQAHFMCQGVGVLLGHRTTPQRQREQGPRTRPTDRQKLTCVSASA